MLFKIKRWNIINIQENLDKVEGLLTVMLSEEEFSLSGITITFNSGTTISVKRATPGGIIKMLRDYERKEGDPCIL